MSAAVDGATPRGTIVVAEDDVATRMILSHVLMKNHFEVVAVENGQLAIEAVRRRRPDVILLDWMMPVMDGRTAIDVLKADSDTRGIPIVMLTSQSEISERVSALEGGAQDFLIKPVDERELLARIEQQMRWRKLLAVDKNEAFALDRLTLYSGSKANSHADAGSGNGLSFVDPAGADKRKRRGLW